MKNRAPLLTVLLGSIILLNAALTADAQSKDKAEIRQWLDQWAKAFRAHDLNAIMSMYAPDVVAYDIVPPLQYVGKEAYGLYVLLMTVNGYFTLLDFGVAPALTKYVAEYRGRGDMARAYLWRYTHDAPKDDTGPLPPGQLGDFARRDPDTDPNATFLFRKTTRWQREDEARIVLLPRHAAFRDLVPDADGPLSNSIPRCSAESSSAGT